MGPVTQLLPRLLLSLALRPAAPATSSGRPARLATPRRWLRQRARLGSQVSAVSPSVGEQVEYDWLDRWCPLAPVCDLDPGAPHGKTVLGLRVVAWYDRAAGGWRVFEDECPHRRAPLSEGRIDVKGRLQCVYHGWCFDGRGSCEFIPQAPALGPPLEWQLAVQAGGEGSRIPFNNVRKGSFTGGTPGFPQAWERSTASSAPRRRWGEVEVNRCLPNKLGLRVPLRSSQFRPSAHARGRCKECGGPVCIRSYGEELFSSAALARLLAVLLVPPPGAMVVSGVGGEAFGGDFGRCQSFGTDCFASITSAVVRRPSLSLPVMNPGQSSTSMVRPLLELSVASLVVSAASGSSPRWSATAAALVPALCSAKERKEGPDCVFQSSCRVLSAYNRDLCVIVFLMGSFVMFVPPSLF